jgi:hypothetical protein
MVHRQTLTVDSKGQIDYLVWYYDRCLIAVL